MSYSISGVCFDEKDAYITSNNKYFGWGRFKNLNKVVRLPKKYFREIPL